MNEAFKMENMPDDYETFHNLLCCSTIIGCEVCVNKWYFSATDVPTRHVQKCQWNFRSWPVNYIHEVITKFIKITFNDIHNLNDIHG